MRASKKKKEKLNLFLFEKLCNFIKSVACLDISVCSMFIILNEMNKEVENVAFIDTSYYLFIWIFS